MNPSRPSLPPHTFIFLFTHSHILTKTPVHLPPFHSPTPSYLHTLSYPLTPPHSLTLTPPPLFSVTIKRAAVRVIHPLTHTRSPTSSSLTHTLTHLLNKSATIKLIPAHPFNPPHALPPSLTLTPLTHTHAILLTHISHHQTRCCPSDRGRRRSGRRRARITPRISGQQFCQFPEYFSRLFGLVQ